ncbi:MAG: 4a-hydroxytetrahydrobiopterin dehydratase [Actinobacteria bacterium]|nr:4a-hydroxytetrahydrobiopterin dehydratase [Actinomycetota bacterium]
MAEPLTGEQIAALHADLPVWRIEEGMLVRDVQAPSFPIAIDYVVAISAAAEEMDHHPDIDIRWRHLRLALVTHSAGGRITDLDVALARRIDDIVG